MKLILSDERTEFNRAGSHWLQFLWVLFCALIATAPAFLPGIEGHRGQDLGFHLMRIEGLAAELMRGNFPVRIEALWMKGYGYPVSIYYGDLFLLLPALLRIAGVPVVLAYKIYLAAVNLVTALISCASFRRVLGRVPGNFAGLLYTTSAYRMMNIYIRAAVGEYTAMAFLPLVLAAAWQIYTDPEVRSADGDVRRGAIRRNAALLALGMSGILACHLLTLEMVCLVLLIGVLILFRRTFRRETIASFALAAGLTVLLSLWFAVPFFDYYFHESVYLNGLVGHARLIQAEGARLSEYFDFFRTPFANLNPDVIGRLPMTPGLPLLLFGVLAVITACRRWKSRGRKCTRALDLWLLLAALLLWLASDFFPWDALSTRSAFFNMLAQVQFPWRFVGLATVFLSLAAGEVIREECENRRLSGALVVTGVVLTLAMTGSFTARYQADGFFVRYAKTEDLNTFDMGFIEYLRLGTQREDFTFALQHPDGVEAEIADREGVRTAVRVRSSLTEESYVTLPQVNYRYYRAVDGSGREIGLRDDPNHLISLVIPPGYEGTITVDYDPPLVWNLAALVSAAAALLLLAAALRRKYLYRGQADSSLPQG